ncbi:uncharacterized protein LOC113860821 [Abrus precatorius]|uniref:Uncharacterized protein LOC113860821 n=1 Tax=Abrus precatorius TaxID=3816 RepID=A0A8B8L0N5_ABRPR|nr:uncharacterized protein LOC113860821 [Abrus precatorius]
MKLSTKPISSPGRTDKFPPPLMRFLRTNAGSRSRRSRSSPMFVRKKNNATIETQEPSSPKVTCMGQVRARRSSKQPATKRERPPTRCGCRCWWIRKPKTCRCQPLWPNWPFFRRKPNNLKQDSTNSHSNFHASNYDSDHEDQDSASALEETVNVNVNVNNAFASNSSTPPKNALLLTRCRSAPYRSSSLAGRFWGSPTRAEETHMPNSESTCHETEEHGYSVSDQALKTEPKLEFLEDSLRERIASIGKSENVEELSKGREVERDSAASCPVVLTRCKSEPAKTGHRLHPELNNLWKKRRLEFD